MALATFQDSASCLHPPGMALALAPSSRASVIAKQCASEPRGGHERPCGWLRSCSLACVRRGCRWPRGWWQRRSEGLRIPVARQAKDLRSSVVALPGCCSALPTWIPKPALELPEQWRFLAARRTPDGGGEARKAHLRSQRRQLPCIRVDLVGLLAMALGTHWPALNHVDWTSFAFRDFRVALQPGPAAFLQALASLGPRLLQTVLAWSTPKAALEAYANQNHRPAKTDAEKCLRIARALPLL